MSSYPVPYNGSSSGTGGDSLTEDLNIYYNAGDIAWMITSTALVLLMIPGVGYAFRLERAHNAFADCNQSLLLWPRPSKVCPIPDLAFYNVRRCGIVPMVLLGLFARFLPYRWEIYW